MSYAVSVYGGHNANIAFTNYKDYYVIELERLVSQRYYHMSEGTEENFANLMAQCLEIAQKNWGIPNQFDFCSFGRNGETHRYMLSKVFNIANDEIKDIDHHMAHACCAFYQSDFEDSIVFSFDGGGNDGVFNVYIANRKEGLTLIKQLPHNLGTAYMVAGNPISEINKSCCGLAVAGKLMGIVGYGKVREDWVPAFKHFFTYQNWDLQLVGNKIGIPLSTDCASGQLSYDLAASAQKGFELVFLDEFEPIYEQYKHLPICLTGGSALNVLLNQILADRYKDQIFIPPNPDDGGLALGQLLSITRPQHAVEAVFNGLPILDKDDFESIIESKNGKQIGIPELVQRIIKGDIIGIIEGDSEVGPRALGHRSIVCNPAINGMKDILNAKVKFREWFRPFAPVARDIDAKKYFELPESTNYNKSYRYMSFAPRVKDEYKEKLCSITHADGTARLQIVSDKDSTFYKILDELERVGHIPVILNTSFNTKGKPILSTYKEALSVLETTELSAVYASGYIFDHA